MTSWTFILKTFNQAKHYTWNVLAYSWILYLMTYNLVLKDF